MGKKDLEIQKLEKEIESLSDELNKTKDNYSNLLNDYREAVRACTDMAFEASGYCDFAIGSDMKDPRLTKSDFSTPEVYIEACTAARDKYDLLLCHAFDRKLDLPSLAELSLPNDWEAFYNATEKIGRVFDGNRRCLFNWEIAEDGAYCSYRVPSHSSIVEVNADLFCANHGYSWLSPNAAISILCQEVQKRPGAFGLDNKSVVQKTQQQVTRSVSERKTDLLNKNSIGSSSHKTR